MAVAEEKTSLQSWHEIVLYGGLWRAFIGMNDYQRANAAKQHQSALVASSVPVEAKEEYDSHRAHLEVIQNEYEV